MGSSAYIMPMLTKICGENTDKGCKVIKPATLEHFRPGYPELYYLCRTCSPKHISFRSVTPEYRRLAKYGVSEIQYQSMIREQGGKCKVCESEDKLCVDHCHTSGSVRGLLCTRCNLLLGMLEKTTPATTEDKYLRIGEYLNLSTKRAKNKV